MSTQTLKAATPSQPPGRQAARDSTQLVLPLLSALAIASLIAEYGFYTPLLAPPICLAVQVVLLALFLTDQITRARRCTDPGHWFSRCWLEVIAGPAAALVGAVVTGTPALATAITAGTIYLALRLPAVWSTRLVQRVTKDSVVAGAETASSSWHPIRPIVATYLLLTILGGILLALPAATVSDHRNAPYTHLLNSLFMAGSAATCTGLSVYDFAGEYTLFGKIVTLTLIQAGGLAIMIFGTLLGLAVARSLTPGPADKSPWDLPRMRRIVKAIVFATLGLESVGAVLLYSMWSSDMTILDRVFHSVFLAISAFCNAGLCPDADSLIPLAGYWQVYEVILPLALLGSLGLPVLYECAWHLRGPSGRGSRESLILPLRPGRWSLHASIVLAVTITLIVVGAAGLYFFETPWRHGGFWYISNSDLLNKADVVQTSIQSMRGHSPFQRGYDAVFQSVAARTAGFKTVLVKPGEISPASLTLLMGLMLIGGAPGSTAGGFHVVPLAILALAVVSTLRGRRQLSLGGQIIPDGLVRRVLAIFFVGICWLGLTVLVLVHMQRADFLTLVFEATSAFSTNGLSLGVTPYLTVVSKIVLLLSMLAGRMGLLVLMLAMTGKDEPSAAESSAETLIVS